VTKLRYPETRIVDQTDVLHGEALSDLYRWLEDGDSPEVRDWTERQNALTESYLGAFPGRARIRARLDALLAIGAISVPTPAHGRYFYQRRDGRQNQPVLYVRDGVGGADRVAVDPNTQDAAGTTALDWYYPSDDGRLLAYGLSENGSEQSVLHVLDLETGQILPERIGRTRAADLAWLPDGSGFYYTRYPAPGEVPEGEEHYHRSIFFHRLGTDPTADPLLFRPAQKEYWPGVSLSPDGRWLAFRSNESGRTEIYVVSFPTPTAKSKISTGGGSLPVWSRDGRELYYVGADRKLRAVKVKTAGDKFEVGVPEELFEIHLPNNGRYDVSKDGRFLVPMQIEQAAVVPLTIVQNWQAGLK